MLAFTNLKVNNIDIWEEDKMTNGKIRVYWSTDDIGSGVIDIVRDTERKIVIVNSEDLGQAFIEKVMETLVRQAIILR